LIIDYTANIVIDNTLYLQYNQLSILCQDF